MRFDRLARVTILAAGRPSVATRDSDLLQGPPSRVIHRLEGLQRGLHRSELLVSRDCEQRYDRHARGFELSAFAATPLPRLAHAVCTMSSEKAPVPGSAQAAADEPTASTPGS